MSELTKKNLIMVKNIITERATFFFDCITNKNHKYSYEMFRKGPVHNLVTIIFVQKKGCTTGLGVDGCGLNLDPIGGPFGGFTLKFLKTQLKDMTSYLFLYF